jgi:hypothetical protein
MLKRYVFFLFLILFAINPAIRAQQPADAYDMDLLLTSSMDSLSEMGNEWGTVFAEVSTTYEYEKLKPVRERLVNLLDQRIGMISGIEDLDGSEEYRASVIEFLSYERKMVMEAFVPFELLTETSTQEEITALISKINEMVEKEKELMDKVSGLQEDYIFDNELDLFY